MKKKPHILLFNPDHYRPDGLAHLGTNPAAVSPNFDALVEAGAVSFRNAYCQATVCTPSRCCFMSGWYPHVRGHRTMYHMLRGRENDPMLLKELKDDGYFVWWGGKNDVVPRQDGFEDYCDILYDVDRHPIKHIWKLDQQDQWRPQPGDPGYYTTYAGKLDKGEDEVYFDQDWANIMGAVEFINNYEGDKPLCIYLPLIYPHPPFTVEEPWFSMIDRSKVLPRRAVPEDWNNKPAILKGIHDNMKADGYTEEQWRELRAVFYGMCARVDAQYGKVADALKERNMYDDTAIFAFSDHGMYLGDYGVLDLVQNTFDDVITGVPFIVKPPKGTGVEPGVSDALVELTDLTATVKDLAGIESEYTGFGKSLLPVIAGEAKEHRKAVYAEGGRSCGEEHCMEKNSTSFSDTAGWYWPRISLQENDVNHTRGTMCRTKNYKYVRRLYERDELYDLREDPDEQNNVVEEASYALVLAEMKERMLTWYQNTGDVVPWDYDKR